MHCKKYIFKYEKKKFDFEYTDNLWSSTYKVIKNFTIMEELENIKNTSKIEGIKFNYKIKPDSVCKHEGEIIIKTMFSRYQVYALLDKSLSDVLLLRLK